MQTYSPIEEAVRQRLLDHFPDLLNENRCSISDLDQVFQAMLEEDTDYGCVIDFAGGRADNRPPFTKDMWIWNILGIFMIRFRGDVAEHNRITRQVVNRLVTLFSNDRRMGGLVSLISVVNINQPEQEKINTVPFYWIAFSIDAIDK